MEVVLAVALFIILMALPAIALALVALIPIGAVSSLFMAIRRRSIPLAALSALLTATAVAAGMYGARYLADEDNEQRIETPTFLPVEWHDPLPRIFVSDGWDFGTPQRLVRAGVIDTVLKTTRRLGEKANAGQTWQAARVKPEADCTAEFAANKLMANRCIGFETSAGPQDAYFSEQHEQGYPENIRTISIFIVQGSSQQLVVRCSAEWPRFPLLHPVFGWVLQPKHDAISRKHRTCYRSAIEGIATGAIIKSGA